MTRRPVGSSTRVQKPMIVRVWAIAVVVAVAIAGCAAPGATTVAPPPAVAAATVPSTTVPPTTMPATAVSTTAPSAAATPIKIGVISILEGPFAGLGEQGIWGVKLALIEAGGKLEGSGPFDQVAGATAGGRPIELFVESSDGSPDKALAAAKILIERDQVDVLVGPLSGDEGIALKSYAEQHLDKTFISGAVSSQDLTLRDAAPNYFRFGTDGPQMADGLGKYAYQTMGLRNVATIGEDYSFPYDQVGAFVYEFCQAGGNIVDRNWVPMGTTDYAASITRIPKAADGLVVVLSGTDAVDFLKSLANSPRAGMPVIGGAVTVDPSLIASLGKLAEGIVSGSPVAVLSTPEYLAYAKLLKETFPGSQDPGLNDVAYYTGTKSLLMGLDQVGGDLSNGQAKLKAALAVLKWTTPTGPISLDKNRSGIANTFITKVVNGQKQVIQTNEQVNEWLGMPEDQYLKVGPFSRTNPPCTH